MKCPLMIYANIVSDLKAEWKGYDCLENKCTWWDSIYERCDPTGLAHTLERLTDEVAELVRKMPHEQQFRK